MNADSWLTEADRLLSEGRNAESVIAIALALESALAQCICATLMEHPEQRKATPAEIEMLRRRYMTTVGKMPLTSLRNLTIHLIIRGLRPQTIPQALEIIEHSSRYASRLPPAEHFAAIDDANTRAAAEALRDTSLVALREAVMHQGRNPANDEVSRQREAVANLARALDAVFAPAE